MRCLEIFSGAGGLAKGLELAGSDHCAFVERNKDACNTLRLNYDNKIIHDGDIKEFNFDMLNNVDLVAGGPPCQPFSLGGKHKGDLDDRDMFPYAIKAIQTLSPKAFIFENVKGLLRKSFSPYFNYIILQLTYPELEKNDSDSWLDHLSVLEKYHTSGAIKGLKYNVIYRIINAADYSVPQKRERVIIVGIRDDLDLSWSFPKPYCTEERLLWDKFITKQYWDRHKVASSFQEKPDSRLKAKIDKLRFKYGFLEPTTQPWLTVRDGIGDLPLPNSEHNLKDHVCRYGARTYPGHTGSFIDEPSKTIKAGAHGVPGGENMIRYHDGSVRYFTILEAKRIQTFPDDYIISGAWTEAMRQLGNAVPVKLGRIVSESLISSIKAN